MNKSLFDDKKDISTSIEFKNNPYPYSRNVYQVYGHRGFGFPTDKDPKNKIQLRFDCKTKILLNPYDF